MILPAAVLTPIQYFMPNVALFTLLGIPQHAAAIVAFTMVGPVLQSVVPVPAARHGRGARRRSTSSSSARPAARCCRRCCPTRTAPASRCWRSSCRRRSIGGLPDRSAVHGSSATTCRWWSRSSGRRWRSTAGSRRLPTTSRCSRSDNVDFSYGQVQVLFDVAFEVRRGEVLALLGTNGAGKSTILRVIAGLGTPARGVVRLNGRNVTYTTPEQRAASASASCRAARACFPAMTVEREPRDGGVRVPQRRRRLPTAARPRLRPVPGARRERRATLASSLSGGQQQMLALAMVLMHDPEVLRSTSSRSASRRWSCRSCWRSSSGSRPRG